MNSNNHDGALNSGARTGAVNYEPSRLEPKPQDPANRSSNLPLAGTTQQAGIQKTLNFRQAGEFYRSLAKQDRANLIRNLTADLGRVANMETRDIMLSHFYKADADYGQAITAAVKGDLAAVKRRAATLAE